MFLLVKKFDGDGYEFDWLMGTTKRWRVLCNVWKYEEGRREERERVTNPCLGLREQKCPMLLLLCVNQLNSKMSTHNSMTEMKISTNFVLGSLSRLCFFQAKIRRQGKVKSSLGHLLVIRQDVKYGGCVKICCIEGKTDVLLLLCALIFLNPRGALIRTQGDCWLCLSEHP